MEIVIFVNDIDGYTNIRIASVATDQDFITVICGDFYVRGTSSYTLTNATTRFRFSDMINSTALSALYL